MALQGIDISNHQAGIDLTQVPGDFVILKATEGTSYVDPYCDGFYQRAKQLGKKPGVYHFMDASADRRAQARFFVENIQGYIGEAILVLDYEAYGRIGADQAWAFMDEVHNLTGVWPILYVSRSVLDEEDFSAVAQHCPLWVAQYADMNPTGYQDDPWLADGSFGAWDYIAMHQYSSTGRLPGYNGNLDLDIAYMSLEAWDKIAQGDRQKAPEAAQDAPVVNDTPEPENAAQEPSLSPDDLKAIKIGKAVIDLAKELNGNE